MKIEVHDMVFFPTVFNGGETWTIVRKSRKHK